MADLAGGSEFRAEAKTQVVIEPGRLLSRHMQLTVETHCLVEGRAEVSAEA